MSYTSGLFEWAVPGWRRGGVALSSTVSMGRTLSMGHVCLEGHRPPTWLPHSRQLPRCLGGGACQFADGWRRGFREPKIKQIITDWFASSILIHNARHCIFTV